MGHVRGTPCSRRAWRITAVFRSSGQSGVSERDVRQSDEARLLGAHELTRPPSNRPGPTKSGLLQTSSRESAGSAAGFLVESAGSAAGFLVESAGSAAGFLIESAGSAAGFLIESAGSAADLLTITKINFIKMESGVVLGLASRGPGGGAGDRRRGTFFRAFRSRSRCASSSFRRRCRRRIRRPSNCSRTRRCPARPRRSSPPRRRAGDDRRRRP